MVQLNTGALGGSGVVRGDQMAFEYKRDASDIVIVTMDMDGQSANTMSSVYHEQMGATVSRLEAEDGLAGVIFASAKKTFFAGGDLHGLLRAEAGDAEYKAWLNEDKGFLRRLEKLPVPVVAAINGAALGGGFEICLACNHRIVVADTTAVVGLPEVTLGLLPGAGGVSRLPRILKLDQALELLLSGRFVAPHEALELGLVDQLVTAQSDLIPAAIEWIKGPTATAQQPWDTAPRSLTVEDYANERRCLGAKRDEVLARTRGKLPAPLRILDVVEQSLELNIDQALAIETEFFAGLLGIPETRAAISLNFFAANAIRAGKMRPEGARTQVRSVALLGKAGILKDIGKAAARKVDTLVWSVADGEGAKDMVLCGADMPVQGDALLNALSETGVCGVEVRDALNDCLSARLPTARVFGFRMPPLPSQSKLVEIIAGPATSNKTLRMAYDFFQRIGHTPIVVKDNPGHFAERLSAAYLNEALALFGEGLPPQDIEQFAYDAGLLVPPLDMLNAMVPLSSNLADTSAVQAAMISIPDAQTEPARFKQIEWSALAKTPGQSSETAQGDARGDAKERLLYIQSIEALYCLLDGVIKTQEEADLASVIGVGFPPHTGGVVQFVRGVGLDIFAARAAELAYQYGPRFSVQGAMMDLLRLDAKPVT